MLWNILDLLWWVLIWSQKDSMWGFAIWRWQLSQKHGGMPWKSPRWHWIVGALFLLEQYPYHWPSMLQEYSHQVLQYQAANKYIRNVALNFLCDIIFWKIGNQKPACLPWECSLCHAKVLWMKNMPQWAPVYTLSPSLLLRWLQLGFFTSNWLINFNYQLPIAFCFKTHYKFWGFIVTWLSWYRRGCPDHPLRWRPLPEVM